MNKKQIVVIVLAAIAIALIVYFTPRYKITWIDSNNFVKTEQTSSLYKRTKGKENFYWDRITVYSSAVVILTGIMIFTFRRPNNG